MKARILLILSSIVFIAGCQVSVEPENKANEIPDNIIPTKPCATLNSRIMELVPEHNNNEVLQPILFSDTVKRKVILTKDTEIYLTFISEGAGNSNTFGWYAYDKATPPLTSGDLELHVLFPKVSNAILMTGDRLKLGDGKFKAGIVVGFFLIVNGWQGGVIDYSRTTLFSDITMNPDQLQQHILFEEKTCGDIVLAFEDTPLNQGSSDHDFNDIIFTISDNNSNLENSSFDQHHIISW